MKKQEPKINKNSSECKNEEKNQKILQNEQKDELNEMKETLQRLQAEFENYQKRVQKESESFRITANASLIKDLLPVLDTLEQGVNHNKELEGVKNQLENILKKKGLEKINIKKGNDFDHDKMDCLMEEECENIETGKIVNILINGYALNGCVLRPAKVSISKEKNIQNKEQKENEEKESNRGVEK